MSNSPKTFVLSFGPGGSCDYKEKGAAGPAAASEAGTATATSATTSPPALPLAPAAAAAAGPIAAVSGFRALHHVKCRLVCSRKGGTGRRMKKTWRTGTMREFLLPAPGGGTPRGPPPLAAAPGGVCRSCFFVARAACAAAGSREPGEKRLEGVRPGRTRKGQKVEKRPCTSGGEKTTVHQMLSSCPPCVCFPFLEVALFFLSLLPPSFRFRPLPCTARRVRPSPHSARRVCPPQQDTGRPSTPLIGSKEHAAQHGHRRNSVAAGGGGGLRPPQRHNRA